MSRIAQSLYPLSSRSTSRGEGIRTAEVTAYPAVSRHRSNCSITWALTAVTWVRVVHSGTFSGMDAAVEPTGMYSRRVPEDTARTRIAPAY
jgi:hypothetical protein